MTAQDNLALLNKTLHKLLIGHDLTEARRRQVETICNVAGYNLEEITWDDVGTLKIDVYPTRTKIPQNVVVTVMGEPV